MASNSDTSYEIDQFPTSPADQQQQEADAGSPPPTQVQTQANVTPLQPAGDAQSGISPAASTGVQSADSD